MNLITSITDVRNATDLTDYTGNLEMRVPLRITDKSNTPYPGRPGTGHRPGLHLHLERPLHRERRPQHRLDCSLATTADTLLPGSALEGRRAIWQTREIEVRDGAGQCRSCARGYSCREAGAAGGGTGAGCARTSIR